MRANTTSKKEDVIRLSKIRHIGKTTTDDDDDDDEDIGIAETNRK